MLEKAGLRIDWALNIPSIIGFSGLCIGIALIAQKLFKDKRITILSILFFLFNGSLSWIRFFVDHPPSWHSIRDIATNTTFPSFAPWGDGDITAFWNLNIYTNQRHLGAAFALALLFIGILLWIEKKPWKQQIIYILPEAAILALLPYFHQPILIILALFMVCYFILFPKLRIPLLLIGGIGILYIIPQIIPLLSGTKTFHWEPGYLLVPPFTPMRVMWYWIQNLGLHFFLIPLGWILAPKQIKKVTSPLLFLFLIPNLFQFSIEMAANHKFFNFYLIIGNMLSAYTLVFLWTHKWKEKMFGFVTKILVLICGVFLVLSGIIDFFPVANDQHMELVDIPKNEIATWIRDNTPPNAIILNSSYFFNPASIAGRKIFEGWPYFAWSAGYDTDTHGKILKGLFSSQTKKSLCKTAEENSISYIMIENKPSNPDEPVISSYLLYQVPSIFHFQNTSIIDVKQFCLD
jgi:hypothetical protein